MERKNAPTLQSMANEAGVSAMTVSVVLNGARSSARVSEATRARILEIAARHGYRRNAAALGLNRRKMDCIGVTATVDGGEINFYFLAVLNGILESAAKYGQNTTIFSIADWEKDEERVLDYCDGRIDGMILIAPQLSPNFGLLLPSYMPFVTLHANIALPMVHRIDVDNAAGSYAVTQHLLSLGHRRLLHFSGGEQPGAVQRAQGFRRALEEAGLAFEEGMVLPGHFGVWSGRELMKTLLARRHEKPLPTAIVCASDAMAYGCLEALTEAGLRVPDDLSLTGFDDTLMASLARPPLTTVRQPFREMGHHAVDMLMSASAPIGETGESERPADSGEERTAGWQTEIFVPELVVRESTGPPPEPS